MKPLVARTSINYGPDEPVLIVMFDDENAYVVRRGGAIAVVAAEDCVVERPSPDFPVGYEFSRVQVEDREVLA